MERWTNMELPEIIKQLEESKEVIRKEVDHIEALNSTLGDYVNTLRNLYINLNQDIETVKEIM